MLRLLWTDSREADLRALPPVSEYRRERAQKCRVETARRAGLCAEWLLISALRKEQAALQLPLALSCEPNGKPGLSFDGLHFNLSHSGPYAACALADQPIGLDIQLLQADTAPVARRFFTDNERAALAESETPDTLFTRFWCRKESFLKAIGLGLRTDLRTFDVSGDRPELTYESQSYGFRETRIGDLFFCLCAPTPLLPKTLLPEEIKLF